jgi:hypothetical protein
MCKIYHVKQRNIFLLNEARFSIHPYHFNEVPIFGTKYNPSVWFDDNLQHRLHIYSKTTFGEFQEFKTKRQSFKWQNTKLKLKEGSILLFIITDKVRGRGNIHTRRGFDVVSFKLRIFFVCYYLFPLLQRIKERQGEDIKNGYRFYEDI